MHSEPNINNLAVKISRKKIFVRYNRQKPSFLHVRQVYSLNRKWKLKNCLFPFLQYSDKIPVSWLHKLLDFVFRAIS